MPERLTEIASALGGVARSLDAVAVESADFRLAVVESDERRQSEHAENRRRDRVRNVMIGVGLFVVAVIGVGNFSINTTANDTLDQVNECTIPSEKGDVHECYERGIAQQGQAVANIICAIRPEYLVPEAAEACVARATTTTAP